MSLHSSLSMRRGFSLVELAIVLSVIGIMLGGVYAVLSSAAETAKREQAFEAIKSVVYDIRALYVPNGGVPMNGLAAMSAQFVGNGTIPQKSKRTTNCANPGSLCADTPWGPTDNGAIAANGTFQICNWPFNGTTTTDCPTAAGAGVTQAFAIALRGLPRSACNLVIAQVTAAGGPSGLLEVSINGNPIGPTGLQHALQPVVPADAAAYCNGVDGANRVDFVYGINSSR